MRTHKSGFQTNFGTKQEKILSEPTPTRLPFSSRQVQKWYPLTTHMSHFTGKVTWHQLQQFEISWVKVWPSFTWPLCCVTSSCHISAISKPFFGCFQAVLVWPKKTSMEKSQNVISGVRLVFSQGGLYTSLVLGWHLRLVRSRCSSWTDFFRVSRRTSRRCQCTQKQTVLANTRWWCADGVMAGFQWCSIKPGEYWGDILFWRGSHGTDAFMYQHGP